MSHRYRTFVDFVALLILEFKYPNTFEKQWARLPFDRKEGLRADARAMINLITTRPWDQEAHEPEGGWNSSPISKLIHQVAESRRSRATE